MAALAERVPPGPATVALLAGIDPRALAGAQQVDLLKAWERHAAWTAAQQCAVLAAMDCPAGEAGAGRVDAAGLPELMPGPGDPEWTQLEVAAALRLSPGTAAQRLDVARALCRRLPATRATLADGRTSYWHAVRIAEATRPLDAETAAAVVDRTVTFCPLPDGMAGLWMVGPAAPMMTGWSGHAGSTACTRSARTSSPAKGRSPPRSPAGSPPTGPGGAFSTTPPTGSCSTTAAPPTNRRPTCNAM